MSPARSSAAVLIYDAECPVCRGTVEWIRRNGSDADPFEFLPCRSEEARARFPAIRENACLQAIHLVLQGGEILVAEEAFPEILLRLRRYRLAAPLLRIPGARTLSRILYRAFARRRHRISRALFRG